jgi:sec-independent protein translocase protein TatA
LYRSGIIRSKGGIALFALIGNFGPWELALVLLIVLIIVGPGKLPQVGQSVGKALQNFRKAKDEDIDELAEKKNE